MSPLGTPSFRPSRRQFMGTTAAVAAASLASNLVVSRSAHAAGSDMLRVGLVGCGSRGRGAAENAFTADPNFKLVALADAFADPVDNAIRILSRKHASRMDINDDHKFVGLDAGQRLMESDVDVVLLCTPPQFRPMTLRRAIEKGKHVFFEKPVAVDAPGIRHVLETSKLADEKGLCAVSGLCWRYNTAVQETVKRVQDGAIGDIVTLQVSYNGNPLWQRPRQPEWTEMEYQVRNWLYFTWLSGDHIVEQAVHSLDKGLWVLGDRPPVAAWGMGGRQVRTDPKYGNIFDHHAVAMQWGDGGPTAYFFARQMGNCYPQVSALITGTKGRALLEVGRIEGENSWRYDGPKPEDPFTLEHKALFGAIRNGTRVNNIPYTANSTMAAIVGRMATYTGALVEWSKAMASTEDLSPSGYTLDTTPPIVPDADGKYPVPMPGITKLV